MTLIDDIIAYSEKTENETHEKITAETEKLKKSMDPADLKDITEYMDQTSTQRRKRLQASKKKKYLHLRYNKDERRPERKDHKRNGE